MNSPVKKTTIITGYNCNNRCVFCIYADRHDIPDKPGRRIVKEMKAARARGNKWLVFVGGEVFIRKDVAGLIAEAKKMGFDEIVAATNGRMFAYRDFAEKVLGAGITQVYFSLHGHTPELHDSLTQAQGSFEQQIRGIKNLIALGFKNIGTHTTIVKNNYRHLPEIASLVLTLGIDRQDFVFVDPNYGGAKKAFETCVPRIAAAAPFIKKALALLKKNASRHYAVRYFPACRLKGCEEYASDLRDMQTVHTEHIGPEFTDLHVERTRRAYLRTKTDKCAPCRYFSACEGVWKEYLKRFGDEELRPVRR